MWTGFRTSSACRTLLSMSGRSSGRASPSQPRACTHLGLPASHSPTYRSPLSTMYSQLHAAQSCHFQRSLFDTESRKCCPFTWHGSIDSSHPNSNARMFVIRCVQQWTHAHTTLQRGSNRRRTGHASSRFPIHPCTFGPFRIGTRRDHWASPACKYQDNSPRCGRCKHHIPHAWTPCTDQHSWTHQCTAASRYRCAHHQPMCLHRSRHCSNGTHHTHIDSRQSIHLQLRLFQEFTSMTLIGSVVQ